MKKRRQVLMSLVLAVSMVLPYSTAFAAEVTTPGGSANSEVTLTVGDTAPKIFSVTVPSEIPVNIRQDGTVEVAKNLNIRNDSSDAVKVTAISVAGKNGWSVAEYAADFSAKPDNSKVIAMQFRGDGTDSAGDITLTSNNWNIPVSTNLDIQAQVKLAKQTQEASKSNIATVSWSFNWKDATDVPDVPDTSAISHNWQDGTPMLAGSNKDVTFDWSSTADTNSIASVESSEPDVASIDPKAISTLVEGQAAYTVTGKSVGTTTITATLTSGESTSFDVTVNEIMPGAGGDGDDIEITVPGDTLKPGDKLNPDMEIEIPVTGPDGDTTITVKPEIPDTELKPGDNEIEVEVDVNGVKITIIIKVTVEGGSDNPSDGLTQSIEEAQAMGFTFSPYEDGLKIDSFENKQFKKEINVPEQIGDFKVLKIGDNVFKGQTNLTKITVPGLVSTIGAGVFSGCSNLAEVVLSGGLVTVGDNAFSGCSQLSAISFPDSVTTLGSGVLEGCANLTRIDLSDNLTTLPDSFAKDLTKLESITLPSKLEVVPVSAFENCTTLTSVHSDGVITKFNDSAFRGCTSLTTLDFDMAISSIGSRAFQKCTSLTSFEIKNEGNQTKVSNYAFRDNPQMDLILNATVTSDGDQAKTLDVKSISMAVGSKLSGFPIGAYGSSIQELNVYDKSYNGGGPVTAIPTVIGKLGSEGTTVYYVEENGSKEKLDPKYIHPDGLYQMEDFSFSEYGDTYPADLGEIEMWTYRNGSCTIKLRDLYIGAGTHLLVSEKLQTHKGNYEDLCFIGPLDGNGYAEVTLPKTVYSSTEQQDLWDWGNFGQNVLVHTAEDKRDYFMGREITGWEVKDYTEFFAASEKDTGVVDDTATSIRVDAKDESKVKNIYGTESSYSYGPSYGRRYAMKPCDGFTTTGVLRYAGARAATDNSRATACVFYMDEGTKIISTAFSIKENIDMKDDNSSFSWWKYL